MNTKATKLTKITRDFVVFVNFVAFVPLPSAVTAFSFSTPVLQRLGDVVELHSIRPFHVSDRS